MGIQLPIELAGVAARAGVSWPRADEDTLRTCAQAWRQAGGHVSTLAGDADRVAHRALGAISGQTGDAAGRHWESFTHPDTGHFTATARGCHAAADRLEHAADQVADAKAKIIQHLVTLAGNEDAMHTAASAGHPAALAGLTNAVRNAQANVAGVTSQLTQTIGLGGAGPGQPATPGQPAASTQSSPLSPVAGPVDSALAGVVPNRTDPGSPLGSYPSDLAAGTPALGQPPIGQHGHGGVVLTGPAGPPPGVPPAPAPSAPPAAGPMSAPAPSAQPVSTPPIHFGQTSTSSAGLLDAPAPIAVPDPSAAAAGVPPNPSAPVGPPLGIAAPSPVFAASPGAGPAPVPPAGGGPVGSAPSPVPAPGPAPAPNPEPGPPPTQAPAQPAMPAESSGGAGVVAVGGAPARPAAVGANPAVPPDRAVSGGGSGGPAEHRATGSRSAQRAAVAVFVLHMFPIGHLPVATDRPHRQWPPPPPDTDFAAGLRFPPHDHPRSELIDTSTVPDSADSVASPGRPAHDPGVQALAAGHDPLGNAETSEFEWDRRFVVRAADPDTGVAAEHAWPPVELCPEGGREPGEPVVLEPGVVLDRFGSAEGRVFAADATPFARRSLPPDQIAAGYHRYEVRQPLPVWQAVSAAWFGQPGGGTRIRSVYPAADLVALGYLKELE
ncbi:MAG TPA: TNT domain-containing protein [Pseudonocardiaceae bacterium]|jgi:hypothetical protein|nr:TNT domain-containing protein [Pseudonocardiaceae bacterium]